MLQLGHENEEKLQQWLQVPQYKPGLRTKTLRLEERNQLRTQHQEKTQVEHMKEEKLQAQTTRNNVRR